jgi:hypothetical protein
MESHGIAGKVRAASATYELVKDDFECVGGREVRKKGKGDMETWFVDKQKGALIT